MTGQDGLGFEQAEEIVQDAVGRPLGLAVGAGTGQHGPPALECQPVGRHPAPVLGGEGGCRLGVAGPGPEVQSRGARFKLTGLLDGLRPIDRLGQVGDGGRTLLEGFLRAGQARGSVAVAKTLGDQESLAGHLG